MRLGGLRIGGRLDRYFGGQHLVSLGLTTVAVLGFFSFFDLTLHLDQYGTSDETGETIGLIYLLRYEALEIPFLFLRTAPLIAMMAGLVTLARVLRSNEWIASVNTGVRPQRLFLPFLAVGLGVAMSMVLVDRELIPRLAEQRQAAWQGVTGKMADPAVHDVWVRDRHGVPLHIDRYLGDPAGGPECELEGLEAAFVGDQGWMHLRADRARFEGNERKGAWSFEGGRIRSLEAQGEAWQPVDPGTVLRLSPEDIQRSVKAAEHPLELTRREVKDLLKRDPANLRLRTLEQSNRALPFANLVLLLTGLPLVLRFGARLAWRGVLLAFVQGFFFFLLDSVTRSMGMEGQLGPIIAGWFPILLYGSVGIVSFASARS